MELQEVKNRVEFFEDRIIINFETHFGYLVLEDFYTTEGNKDRINDEWFYQEYFEQFESGIIDLLLIIEHEGFEYYDFQLRLIKLKRIIDSKLSIVEKTTETFKNKPTRTPRRKQFLINISIDRVTFIKELHKQLINNKLINTEFNDFERHFKNKWDCKIEWLGTEIQITNLITLLIENEYLTTETNRFKYELIKTHFVNKKGKEFNTGQLSSVYAENKEKTFGDITNDIIDEISTHL